MFGSPSEAPPHLWQDREIRFDVPVSSLEPRAGEFSIDNMGQVEDTKGNNGEVGQLHITNLRLIWTSQRSVRMNLTVGYNCIVSMNIRQAASRLRGGTQALYILTKFNHLRFEFIFTNLVKDSPRLFTTIQAVFRAYDTTRLYRDLKLRGALIFGKELKLLELEQLYNKVNGVWNLSSEQGNLGTFFVSNVRVVWHGNLAEGFNVSIPYLQMTSVKLRESKFGQALVIETHVRSGGYILGFKIEPPERMQEVCTEINSLWKTFSAQPVLGVEFKTEQKAAPISELTVQQREDDVEVVDSGRNHFAVYAGEDSAGQQRGIVFNEELGLAMEALPEGVSLQQLSDV
eukprot:jgi/Astpho2/8878/e_gw1.00129.36.1_t